MYGIKINKVQFIEWCNSCWYGTSKKPVIAFTLEQVRAMAQQLRSHYIYKVDVVDENERLIETITSKGTFFPKKEESKKKSLFKLSKK